MATQSGTSDMIGMILAERYQLVRLLGQGGMATVYEGRHVVLGSRVAIKILDPRLARNEIQRKRFIREARASSQIASEHVIKVLDFGENPFAFFVMEFLDGRDLSDLVEHEGKVPWPRARAILLQVIGALRAAHSEGIVHRDMKPSNVFVQRRPDGTDFVKVLDFGIAKVADATPNGQGLTRSDEVLGTIDYMAPEQALAKGTDPRSDIYAVGIMLYEMLAGTIPFPGKTPFEVIEQHIKHPPPPLTSYVPSLPKPVEDIVLRAIEKKPEDRFQGMDEFEAAVRRVSPNGRVASSKSSGKAVAAVAMAIGLMMMGAGVAYYLHLGPFAGWG